MSSAIFSTTAAPSFSYIIPYGQSSMCKIYGVVCQTGSITVGVDLTTTTITTVLPCSSYLTAQSNYIDDSAKIDATNWPFAMTWNPWVETGYVQTWAVNFGRSPECRSFAQAYSNSLYTFSGCGSSNMIFSTQVFWN